jgi:hypothetical protein
MILLPIASVSAGSPCPEGQVACDKSPGGCRTLREDLLRVDESGYRFAVSFAEARVELGRAALQQVAPEAQLVRDRYRLLVLEFNACTWTEQEYQERVDQLLAYDRRVQDAGFLVAAVDRISESGAASEAELEEQNRALATLSEVLKKLGNDTTSLRREIRESRNRIAALDVRADALVAVREALKAEQEALRQERRSEAASLAEETREQLAAWSQAVDAEVKARTEALQVEIDRLRGDVSRLMTAFAEGRLRSRRYLLNAMPSLWLLGGGPRPGLLVSVEALAPPDGFPWGLSLALEAGGVWWKEQASFDTLPGALPVRYDRDDSFLLLDAGLRYYLPSRRVARFYVGGFAGILSQPSYGWENLGLAFQAAAGVLLVPASWRIGLEVRYALLQTRSKLVRFDPFGGARVEDRHGFRGALTVGLTVTPLAW